MRSYLLVQGIVLAWLVLCGISTRFACGQPEPVNAKSISPDESSEAAEFEKERIAAGKFLELLKRRPRLGTAFDKVYGFHVSNGTLEQLASELAKEAAEKNNGNLWLILGMLESQRGQDSQAVAALEQAVKLLPTDPMASYYLGKSLILLGQTEQAAGAFQQAISKKPPRADMLDISQELGRVYQRIGRTEEAQRVWTRLEAEFPGDQQVQEEIASILVEEGANAAALLRFEALAKNHKDRSRQIEMSIRAAQLRAKLGQRDESLREYEQVLGKVNPDSWLHRDVRKRIEDVYLASQDYDGLIDYYTKWIQSHPEDVDAMMRAGRQLSIQRRGDEARAWFRRAIDRAPSNVDSRQALVDSLVADNEFTQAVQAIAELVKIEPDNIDHLVRWGEMTMLDEKSPKPDRQKQAAEIWKRMLTKRGSDPVTVARIADLLRGAELADEAIAQYHAAIKLADAEPQYREYLGEYLHQLGRKDQAIAIWNEIASGARRTRDNLVRLSEVYSAFQYPDKALGAIEQACQMQPNFAHRARYAQLLKDANQFDAALVQLDFAESLADDAVARETVIDERIKLFRASGTLSDRIISYEKLTASEKVDDADTWRLLALMYEADSKYQLAGTAIGKAVSLAPTNVVYWTASARMHERTGNIAESIAAYRKLMTLDRRYLSNYLTQIANLQMRLGNVDESLKAGQELLAAAPGNSDNYQLYANLCFQAGKASEGLEILRRNVRAHPNDVSVLNHLARFLSAEYQTEEAIEIYWRVFDLEKAIDGKTPTINALAELYLRTNRFDTLLKRLETIGREQNNIRESNLWLATAHQAAGDFGVARQVLERLVREDSRDTKLLEQMVALARAEFDFDSAAEYQRRINSIAPSGQGDYMLATFLLDAGRIDEAESSWMKIASQKVSSASSSTAALESIDRLLAKDQYEVALALLQKVMPTDPDNWEYFVPAMRCLVRTEKLKEARELAERVKKLNIDPTTRTARAKEMAARLASQSGRTPSAAQIAMQQQSMSSAINGRLQSLSIARMVKSMLQASDSDPFSGTSFSGYTVTAFGEVLAFADGVLMVTQPKDFDLDKEIGKRVEIAKKSKNPQALWDAIYAINWKDNGTLYQIGDQRDQRFDDCLNLLIAQGDNDAILQKLTLMINEFSRRRRSSTTGEPITPEALSKEKLEEFEKLATTLDVQRNDSFVQIVLPSLCSELLLAGEQQKADKLIERMLNGKNPFELSRVATILAQAKEPDIDRLIELIQKVTSNGPSISSAVGNSRSIQMLTIVLPTVAKYGSTQQLFQALDYVFKFQASKTAQLRPSEQNSLTQQVSPIMYPTAAGMVRITTNFPPPSGYFDVTTMVVLRSVYDAWLGSEKFAELRKQLFAWTQEKVDDRFLRIVRHIASTTVSFWAEDRESALAGIQLATDSEPGVEILELLQVRMLHEAGKPAEAMSLVEQMRPANTQMMIDRELTILQLSLQLGQIERAKQSAQKLFALRLNSDTEFKLAELMYQIGMKDLGDRMMDRVQRKAGGQQSTLVEVMNRFVAAGQSDRAAEIARQIVRRTRPRISRTYSTSENQQNEQAIRVLVQTNKAGEMIKQLETQYQRSPKSIIIIQTLAALYDATGKRKEAQDLRIKSAQSAPSSSGLTIQAATALASAGRHAEAVEKYLQVVRKDPNTLSNSFYEFQNSFNSAKAWPKLVDLIEELGPAAFRSNSYVFNNFANALRNDPAASKRMIQLLLKRGDWDQFSHFLQYSGASSVGSFVNDLDEPSKEKILAKLIDPNFRPNANTFTNSYSYSTGGVVISPSLGVVLSLCRSRDIADRVIEAANKMLEKNEHDSFSRILLLCAQIGQRDLEKVPNTLKYWLESKNVAQADSRLLWLLASQLPSDALTRKLAIELMEKAVNVPDSNRNVGGTNPIDYQPIGLLINLYTKDGRKADAKSALMKMYRQTKMENGDQVRYPPGYLERQYFDSLQSIATKLVDLDFPAEAYIVYRRLSIDGKLREVIRQQFSSSLTRFSRLESSIFSKLTGDHTVNILSAALGNQPIASSQSQPVIDTESMRTILSIGLTNSNLMDYSISFPVAFFTERIQQNDKVKQQVAKLLDDWKTPDNPTPLTLAATFLAANASEHKQVLQQSVEAIEKWLAAQPPPKPRPQVLPQDSAIQAAPSASFPPPRSGPDRSPVTPPKPPAAESARKNSTAKQPPINATNKTGAVPAEVRAKMMADLMARRIASRATPALATLAPLPDELVLILVAEKLPAEHAQLAERLLHRARQVALASGYDDFANVLEVRAAKYISTSDPARASQLMLDALERLIPKQPPIAVAADDGRKGPSPGTKADPSNNSIRPSDTQRSIPSSQKGEPRK